MGKRTTLKEMIRDLEAATELNNRALNSIDEQMALMSIVRREEREGLRRDMEELRSTVEALRAEVGALNELMRLIAANQLLLLANDTDA